MSQLIANYHTHTTRCGHAEGTEREYIEAAIEAGLSVLGFADHGPWPFKNGFKSGIRLEMKDVGEYFDTLIPLKEEYKKDIEIKIGFECEYFADLLEEQQAILKDYPLEYMILGHHFVRGEQHGIYIGAPFTDKSVLKEYVDDAIAGMKTGLYAYLCHPDLPNFKGDPVFYEEQMKRLCCAAKELNIPLEINMYGYNTNRNYPTERFFKWAKEIGNTVIFGVDAHFSHYLKNKVLHQKMFDFSEHLGLNRIDLLDF
ncbi:MAG: PHP domain-containing protein [Lachnospiraceae bacterium]|nr:PHP domain-containing protein [Lachnospiraceae bacterium]